MNIVDWKNWLKKFDTSCLLRLNNFFFYSRIITDWAIGTVSSLLKIKSVESQKIKRTPFCGFERFITH